MLKFKRKLLAVLLAVCVAVGSGAGVVWSEDAEDTASADENVAEDTSGDDGEASDGEASDTDTDAEPAVTEEEALAKMTVYAENSNLKLYIDESTCIFAVENKKSGYIWWSTPYDYESDPFAAGPQKQLMASMVVYRVVDMETGNLMNTNTYSYDASVSKGTFSIEKIENGAKFTYDFTAHNLSIPVSLVLGEDSFSVTVHSGDIQEGIYEDEKIYHIVTMSICPSLGAGRADEDGYILVPDGSGAAIEFNNGKTSTTAYQARVYGRDYAVSQETAPTKTEQVYLPVIGIMKESAKENNALLAVCTSGDGYASVNATVAEQATTSINSGWFSFDLRATDTYKMGTKTPLTVFQSGDLRSNDITIRYYPMNGSDLNYADLAATYRQYLIDEKGLAKQSSENSNALYITLMGGTITKKSVLGFPVDQQTVATSYSQALEIIKELEEAGVDDMIVIYNDFNDCGINGKISSGVNYSNKLGGKNAFTELNEYVSSQGYTLYPSIDIMEYTRSGYGYSFTLNSSKRITNAYATQTAFNLAYSYPDTDVKPTWTILSPYYWPDLFNKILKSWQDEGLTTISLTQATSLLYSDFSRVNFDGESQFVREDSIELLIDGYEKFISAGISIIAQECNAYALPYVSAITDVPMYSSNYDLFDYDVPFYQMVIHGYIPYSSKALNGSSNEDELLLYSLLGGAGAHYEMMYNSPKDFEDSDYDGYFYASYDGWISDAAENYAFLNENISSLSDKTITKFTTDGAKKYTVTYSDGTEISIDCDLMTYSINGQEKNLADELEGE